jgi:ABC-type proline/glycine betaine transport system substrate-binding protein
VVSFGRLGVLGRNGWFCREADVEQLNALAGWRGLKDPAARQHFNGTFLAFESDGWGPNQQLMTSLNLPFEPVYFGADAAEDAIRARLDASLPAFFYLWSPHAFNSRYSLNRIQLPAYTPALFKLGLSDYPTDVLEKVAAKTLSEHAPDVAKMYSLFRIDNAAQESMLDAIDSGLSVMQATCAWMQKEENAAVWGAWLPVAKLACDPGNYAVDESSCAPCPAGSASVGGAVSTCTSCSAGKPS